MKKMLILITIVTMTTLSLFGQWEIVKQGDELLANFTWSTDGTGFMLDANTGWQVGDNGLVIKTTDGGATWTTMRADDGTGLDWLDVQFFDENTGYACGEDGYIFKTTDGGANWDMIGDTANYKVDFSFLKVIDANTVFFAGDDGVLLKTSDGGTSYIKSDNTFEGLDLDGGIDFCNANVGVVASDDNGGYTWYTHNGGTTWNLTMIDGLFPYGVSKFSVKYVGAGGDSTIVLGTRYRVILISQDGGKSYTWKGDYTLATDYYYAVSVIDENTFFLSGDGLTVRTTDGGASWDSLNTGTGQETSFMDFIDANTGFIFADYNQWMKTTDGGETFSPILDWPGIYFRGIGATSNTIFVTAFAGGEITSSSDGGTTWTYPTNLSTGVAANLDKCEFFDDNNGIIVGQNGNLLRTSNGGTTWTLIDNPMYIAGKSICTVAYYTADTIFAGGASGYLMRSVDGGLTWSDTYLSNSKTVYGLLPVNGKTVIACGQSGYLYEVKFVDATTIDDSLYNTGTEDDFNAIVSHGDSIYLVSDEGNLFKTSLDKLDSLTQTVVDAATDEMNDLVFIDDTLAFIAGKSGKVYRSEDAGITWIDETSPTTGTIYDLAYFNNALWGVTNGQIIKLQLEEPGPEPVSVTFNVDMSVWAIDGKFDPSSDFVDIAGTFNNWGASDILDDSDGDSIYSIVLDGFTPGETIEFKFRINGSWDDNTAEFPYGAPGRQYVIPDSNSTYTAYYNNDETPLNISPGALPKTYVLRQNFPNPFNPTTDISFDLPKDSQVEMVVYNMVGQQVAVLKNEAMQAGSYSIHFDASQLSSGVYFYRIKAGDFTALKKMILLK